MEGSGAGENEGELDVFVTRGQMNQVAKTMTESLTENILAKLQDQMGEFFINVTKMVNDRLEATDSEASRSRQMRGVEEENSEEVEKNFKASEDRRTEVDRELAEQDVGTR